MNQQHKRGLCHDEIKKWFQNAKWFFRDANRVLAVLTAALVLIGIGALYIQRDTEQRQLRAYMIMTDFAVSCPDCGDTSFKGAVDTGLRNYTNYRIENNGQTPAYKVSTTTNWWHAVGADAQLPSDFAFPDHKMTGFVSSSDIGRDKHKDGGGDIGPEYIRDFVDAAANRTTLFIYGHVDYCDIFGQAHSTAYCFVYKLNRGEHLPICDRFNGEIPPRGRCL